ncbi:MAG: hypothetical protein M1825_001026 [Sarcosagium campestre]|nr:MAG: hypothetical protein M1825_001026 [Sarcosagium campestre]
MPPRKNKIRHSAPAATSHQTELPFNVDELAASLPSPTTKTNAELNLSVLQRHHSDITSIISIAPYAVVYIFSSSEQQWEKSGIEGTLFVCQLAADYGIERYSAIILNRRGLENFAVELHSSADVDITEDYVILRAEEGSAAEGDGDSQEQPTKQRIYGLWIFCEPAPSSTANTRAINAQIIQDCAVQAEMSRRNVATAAGLSARVVIHAHTAEQEAEMGEAEEAALESEPMGRQLSLRELFGQQRAQDSEWSVKNHNSNRQSSGGIGTSNNPGVPSQFTPSADTDFFRSSSRPSLQPQQQQKQQQQQQRQEVLQLQQQKIHHLPQMQSPFITSNVAPRGDSISVMDLFRKAGDRSTSA